MDQTPDAGIQISWLGTFCRLLVVLLFIGFFSWGAWKLSQPANIWTSNSEIQKTESDVRGIHRDAEKARKEMETSRTFSVESLVYHVLNNGYELTDEERLYVQTNWNKFVRNSNIDDDENLLFRLRMRHAEDGSIEDFPLDEWMKKNMERKKAEEEKEKEAQMRQAMMQGAQDVVQKNSNIEENRVKAEDREKKIASEKRSNREIVRNVVEEVKENIYSGKPIGETEPQAEEPEEDVPADSEPEEEKVSDSK
ncbi:MAG: hypothetical protein IJQ31_07140 [Thermoguttaceae bacterium]|nr:hypothetical protein [Thermoguttaceae bacterium]